jgi:uncharacterized membrane protein
MEPAVVVGALWIVFGGLHVGLATRRVRAVLVHRLGEWGFLGLFSLVASASFSLLVHVFAIHRLDGSPGLALGQTGPLRAVLIVAVIAGVVLAVGSLGTYPASAYAMGAQRAHAPHGLERVTRHPFFAGTATVALAHALLATRLTGTVFFGGLTLLAVAGAWHQDRKLLARRGEPFARFLAATSVVPFAAIPAGRQQLVLRELPWAALTAGLPIAFGLRAVHEQIFARGGLWVIVSVVGGAAVLMLQEWWRAQRTSRHVERLPSAVR